MTLTLFYEDVKLVKIKDTIEIAVTTILAKCHSSSGRKVYNNLKDFTFLAHLSGRLTR